MAGESAIEWTDATWNPLSGCTKISPGCKNCYAIRMAARLQSMNHPAYEGVTRKSGSGQVWTGRVNLNDAALDVPLRWKAPRRIFVNSMSDLFQEAVPAKFVERVWQTMAATPRHTYQVLTKRPDRMAELFWRLNLPVLSNVWLGTSVENRRETARILELRRVPAAVRFISFEPLLSDVGRVELSGIHWAIVGGESGPRARPMKTVWVERIHTQCLRSGVSFFFKQWGGTNKKATGRTYAGRTWDEYPSSSSANAAAE